MAIAYFILYSCQPLNREQFSLKPYLLFNLFLTRLTINFGENQSAWIIIGKAKKPSRFSCQIRLANLKLQWLFASASKYL